MTERFKSELDYRNAIYEKKCGQGRVMFHQIHATGSPKASGTMNKSYRKVVGPKEELEQFLLDLENQNTKQDTTSPIARSLSKRSYFTLVG